MEFFELLILSMIGTTKASDRYRKRGGEHGGGPQFRGEPADERTELPDLD